MENKAGINSEKLNILVTDLYEKIEHINSILNQVSETVERSKNSFTSTTSTSFLSMYDNFKTNYNVVVNNLQSYATDFTNLNNKYLNRDHELKEKVTLKLLNIENMYGTGEYNEHR